MLLEHITLCCST